MFYLSNLIESIKFNGEEIRKWHRSLKQYCEDSIESLCYKHHCVYSIFEKGLILPLRSNIMQNGIKTL